VLGHKLFTGLAGTPFDGVCNSFIAFADEDGNHDQGVIIIGASASVVSAKGYLSICYKSRY